DVQHMALDIRRPVKKICPREPVQMWVTVDARLPKQSSVTRLETWAGDAKARRNGMLDFANFAFTSGEGSFDEYGWFRPNGDVFATVERGFGIRAALRHQPDRVAELQGLDPDYRGVRTAGGAGRGGREGNSGSGGSSGADGNEGSAGVAGAPGAPGDPGGPGESGPRLTAFATFVRTRFYPRLIAVRIDGPVRDFMLAPPDQELTLIAQGGPGGGG